MNLKNSLQSLVLISLLGATWGALEVSLGTTLHALGMPFCGGIMASLGMLIVTVGYTLVPKLGVAISIGLVSAFLKLFSIGVVKINPVIGIVTEAIIAEIIFDLLGRKKIAIYLIFILVNLFTIFQNYITMTILSGYNFKYFLAAWKELLSHFNIAIHSLMGVILIYVGMKLFIGILIGIVASKISFELIKRMKFGSVKKV